MRSLWFLMVFAFVAGSLAWAATNNPPPAEPIAPPTSNSPIGYVGNAGCSATGCHNNMGPAGTPGAEYSTWAAADPHAKAYGVLFHPDAERMERLYRKLPPSVVAAPQNDELCLKCHAPMAVSNPQLKNDAVGCESCHGPAGQWRTTHYLRDWQSLSNDAKVSLGLANTKNLVSRVEMCAKCHVGAPGMEVDHELIASGHPRLLFDYSAYHDLLPRHWKEPDETAFPARAWAVGRLVAAKSALDLLTLHAQDEKKWPELADFNCYACHRPLTADLDGPTSAQPLGELGLTSWHLALLDRLNVDNEHLAVRHLGLRTPRLGMAASADKLKSAIDTRLHTIDHQPFDPKWAANLQQALTNSENKDWDSATQNYLALAAMHRALKSPPKQKDQLTALRDFLRFEPGHNSPSRFSPQGYRQELIKFGATRNDDPTPKPGDVR